MKVESLNIKSISKICVPKAEHGRTQKSICIVFKAKEQLQIFGKKLFYAYKYKYSIGSIDVIF